MNTTQEQKSNLREYDQKFEEIKDITSKTKQKYVPELCEILRKADPTLVGKQIGDKVKEDCEERLGWNWDTVQRCLPSFAVGEKASQSAKRRYEQINRPKLEKMSKIFQNLKSVEIPQPPEVKVKDRNVIDDEEWERTAPSSKYLEIGEKGKTLMEQLQEIRAGAHRLFVGLTEKGHLPYPNEDVIVDYIKTTREFRRSLVSEMEERQRINLYNDLGAVDAAVQDMLEILEQNKNKK